MFKAANLECFVKNQTTWENGAIVREAMKELIGRFPSQLRTKSAPTGDSDCLQWQQQNQANQMQICKRQSIEVKKGMAVKFM